MSGLKMFCPLCDGELKQTTSASVGTEVYKRLICSECKNVYGAVLRFDKDALHRLNQVKRMKYLMKTDMVMAEKYSDRYGLSMGEGYEIGAIRENRNDSKEC